ncbi:MAG: RNA polymerase sigma factor [Lewinellaceae bacterium]|nr:RNA polymerase sigma factor [Lewinellaceae bacterium]
MSFSGKFKKEHDAELDQILEGCRQLRRSSQQRLFALFYNYAMTISRRYMGNLENAEEVVNDAFFKVFTKLNHYSSEQPFRFWLRRIVINTAIDRLRSGVNTIDAIELQAWHEVETDTGIVEDLTREQVLAMIDHLPPAYRTVFNLFVVDGHSHEEIAEMLGIGVGTSKSNLARARQHLKTLFINDFEFSRKI